MVITWADLTYSYIVHPAVDSVYTIQKTTSSRFIFSKESQGINGRQRSLFDSPKNVFEKHQEDDYIDFYYERNIPEMLSREGPKGSYGRCKQ